ncbi:MAG: hypothetical protein H7333_08560, partial [Bdellovibrionales bacterium]|nr:hypothetical protein [Oligoflexia bacterium]
MGFLFLALAFLNTDRASADFLTIENFGLTSEWLGLLQYQKNFLGFERSEIDGASFFLSPQGAVDPVSELNATLSAFSAPIQTDKKGEDN